MDTVIQAGYIDTKGNERIILTLHYADKLTEDEIIYEVKHNIDDYDFINYVVGEMKTI